MGFFSKIFGGLKKTKKELDQKLDGMFDNVKISDDFYEELEFVLLSSDLGAATTDRIIEDLKTKVKKQHLKYTNDCRNALKEILVQILTENKASEISYPLVIMVIGVNGVGKTTTIGKLAKEHAEKGKKVVVAAADTFRAAAASQLAVWADRADVQIVKSSEGTDPGAVVFDAISSFKAKKSDVLIIDTAGRLHNKIGLMAELEKISRIVSKELPNADYHKVIVIDATTGQNAIEQVRLFNESVGLTDLIITKLDGSSKGGVLFSLCQEFKLPIRHVGVGEGVDDLIEFVPTDFVDAIF